MYFTGSYLSADTLFQQDKITTLQNWNLVARDYHDDWASKEIGPFKATAELVRAASVNPSDSVLDVACGTGAVSAVAAKRLHPSSTLVGIDLSNVALSIAARFVPRGQFAQMDAEHIGLLGKFDRIFCQYALMFFPDPQKVLNALGNLIEKNGVLAISVHGAADQVPYFSTIMTPVLAHIPDIRPIGSPNVHRFGRPDDLERTISEAGFSEVSVTNFTFEYEAGTFEDYWSDYLATTAASIRARIAGDTKKLAKIKTEAEDRASRFLSEQKVIVFPWQVLIATARHD
ncbi:MAG TPA: methyltransferase domain-containing protein [Nitrososphaera sp.]